MWAQNNRTRIFDDKKDKPNLIKKNNWKNYKFWPWKTLNALVVSPGIPINAKKKHDECQKVVLAMDSDKSGQAMAEEFARRIGKDKCFKIEYPEDCKDANEVLVKHGAEELDKITANPIPYTVSGL